MQMLGQTVEARSKISPWVLFFVVMFVALVAWAALASSYHPLFPAALALALAIGLVLGRPPGVDLLVDREGLRTFGSHQMIAFSDITAITVGGREYGPRPLSIPNDTMEIHHTHGILPVPARTNIDFRELHNFLRAQIPPPQSKPVPPVLGDYLAQHVNKFGRDKVTVINTRRDLPVKWRLKRRRWISAAILLTAVVWFAGALAVPNHGRVSDEYTTWIVLSVFLGIGGIVAFLAPAQSGTGRLLTKHPDSCLIIAPPGIALLQGDTKGALPWHEITKITAAKRSQFGRYNNQPTGIVLRVRGADIIIFDIYDRTPADIEQLLRRNLDLPTG